MVCPIDRSVSMILIESQRKWVKKDGSRRQRHNYYSAKIIFRFKGRLRKREKLIERDEREERQRERDKEDLGRDIYGW